jgi:hypothetical protein
MRKSTTDRMNDYDAYDAVVMGALEPILVVRRQSFWDSELVHLREALARLLGDVMRPADDAASVDW